MIYILGSIITSCLLVILFRIFQTKNIHLIQAITVNYWVCVICGFLYNPEIFQTLQKLNINVYSLGVLQGFLFIFMFFQIGKASQEIGLSYTGLFGRISVIIPVGVSIFFFHEKISLVQGMGLFMAILAIYFLNTSEPSSTIDNKKVFTMGSILFVGNGIIDSVFKIYTFYYSTWVSQEVFTLMVFGTAGVLGSIYLLVTQQSIELKNAIAGIVLGIPNFFSLIFMLKGLKFIDGAKFFPLNNIGIILLLTFVGIWAFQEKIYPKMWIGLLLTVLSILLISELITFNAIY